MLNVELLKKIAIEILGNVSLGAYSCIPMSAMLYVILKDRHNINTHLITGDLSYKDHTVFKQNFSIPETTTDFLSKDWTGHAWVEFDDLICDLSFFRTLYSSDFNHSCKEELISQFGLGKGFLGASKNKMKEFNLFYNAIDTLSDRVATSIIRGFYMPL
jgi:hypothetical protein